MGPLCRAGRTAGRSFTVPFSDVQPLRVAGTRRRAATPAAPPKACANAVGYAPVSSTWTSTSTGASSGSTATPTALRA